MGVDAKSINNLSNYMQSLFLPLDQLMIDHMVKMIDKKPIGNNVFHYTNASDLRGVITDENIWMTDCRFLNDPSETSHGLVLNKIRQNEVISEIDEIIIDYINDIINFANSKEIHDFLSVNIPYYVFCCSKISNDLSNWRLYGDNGRGFCIVFSKQFFSTNEIINDLVELERYSIYTTNVSYNNYNNSFNPDDALIDIFNYVNKCFRENPNILSKKPIREAFSEKILFTMMKIKIVNSLSLKNKSYKNEKEIRQIMISSNIESQFGTKFRVRGNEIIPYISVPRPIIKPDMITEIIVGPAAAPHVDQSVRSLLRSKKMDWVKVTKSQIPYRAI